MNRFRLPRWLALTLIALCMATAGPESVRAQGVTTATLTGRVTDGNGAPIVGATVLIRNLATGSEQQTLTRSDGRYVMPALRPGGPYRIEVGSLGYGEDAVDGVQLTLGETRGVDFVLAVQAVALEELAVEVERGADVGGGVTTVVDDASIQGSPTLNRELVDLARFTPQAFVSNEDDDGAAISIAGQNAEFNGLYIDGVVNNDVFGLSAQGTNGGQTGAPPISFDALEQMQIAISPFDVSQSGFTGGAINVITRSGTNEFTGSLYYQTRNADFAGKTPGPIADDDRTKLPEFTNRRYGFRLGGPIIRDKAFFFVNGELFRSETPRPFTPSTYRGAAGENVGEVASMIRDVVRQETGYDAGDFGDKDSSVDDNKFLAKVDWLINADHRLSARHSYSQTDNIDAFGSGGGSINYANNSEVFPNTTNSTAIELNSRFGNNISNRLLLGATFVRDDRGFAGDPFPRVTIRDGSGSFNLGSEPFSTGNVLNQDVFSVTNNFNLFMDRHTLTFGAHFEYYDILNLFIRQNFGVYEYASVDDFLRSVCAAGSGSSSYCQELAAQGAITPAPPIEFERGFSLVDDVLGDASNAAAAFSAYQFGFYAQDEFQATDRLKLTLGLRVDVPKITTKPTFAEDVFDTTIPDIEAAGYDLQGAEPGKTPGAQPYFAPRFGFNFDLSGDRMTQLRGGIGIFTGRVPFVYPGAMYTNNGVTTGFVSEGGTLPGGDPIPFQPDPANALDAGDFGLPTKPNGELDIFTEDFKYPRVMRTSLGIDAALPYGFTGTLEAQYTKNIDNIIVENVNYKPHNATLNGPDDRPIYNYGINDFFGSIDVNQTLIDPRYSNGIYKVGSTSEGYSYDVTASLQRQFLDGRLSARGAYTFGDSRSLNDATSDQISSTFRFNENVNGLNSLELARSDWSIGHRILGQLNYRQEFLENLATSISLVYTGESGRPYSFIIGNSFGFTGEGNGTAPLAYIPDNASELRFADITNDDGAVLLSAQAQAQAFESFIQSDDYLRTRRGQYAERNARRTPFEHVIDLRLAQELFANIGGRRNTLEVTVDIFNLTNLLDSEWGLRYDPGFRTVDLLEFERFAEEDAVAGDDLTPIYTFRFPTFNGGAGVQSMDEFWETEILDFGTYGSRWQMQIGLRYSF